MKRPSNDVTAEALLGFEAPADAKCPFLWSSNASAAWHIGRWLRLNDVIKPAGVRPSRGDSFHVCGRKVRLFWQRGKDAPHITWEGNS